MKNDIKGLEITGKQDIRMKSNMLGKIWAYFDLLETLSQKRISDEHIKYGLEQKLSFQKWVGNECDLLDILEKYGRRLNENLQMITIELRKKYKNQTIIGKIVPEFDLNQKMYSVIEVAKIVGVSRQIINNHTNTGELPVIKIAGKSKRITENDLQKFLSKHYHRKLDDGTILVPEDKKEI